MSIRRVLLVLALALALLIGGGLIGLEILRGGSHVPASASEIERSPHLDPGRPIEERARLALAEMSLEEKIEQLHGIGQMYTVRNERLKIPDLRPTDGPRGIGEEVWRYLMRHRSRATAFPAAIALAASWDPELAYEVGAAIAAEAKAKGRNWLLAPCINVVRDPRAGRTQEGYGEDPYLIGRLAVSFIRGVQDQQVIATPKHLVCNNQETDRDALSADVEQRALREIYLPAFEASLREGGAWSIMASYNSLNGVPTFEHRQLLTDLLRGEWGFDGLVVSDWKSILDGERSLLAGLDVEMPTGELFASQLAPAVEAGRIPTAVLDEAVLRVLRVKLRAGLFERPVVVEPSVVHSAAHRELAAEVARRSVVLLRNDGLLPLRAEAVATLAVVGPAADTPRLGDDGSSEVRPFESDSVLSGIRDRLGDRAVVRHAAGSGFSVEVGGGLAAAVALAAEADAAILVVGLDPTLEGERVDRPGGRLRLPEAQEQLAAAVLDANPRTVVVLLAGSAVALEPWLEKARAVLHGWYPGERGGQVLAEVIFGDISPSGKLPLTMPAAVDQLPGYPGFPDAERSPYTEGVFVGYRWFERQGHEPSFPFGHGLAYTTFEYRELEIASPPEGLPIRVSARITNTGDRAGAEVAQLYVHDRESSLPRPEQELKGFRRVRLEPGESTEIRFELGRRDLAFYDPEPGGWVAERGVFEVRLGSSSADIRLRGEVAYEPPPADP